MRKLLFTAILFFITGAFGGGSEVPWPSSSEEPVFLEDIAGFWIVNSATENTEQVENYYQFLFKISGAKKCPYVVEVNEFDMDTRQIRSRGSSNYCLPQPRQLSFVMVAEGGSQNRVLTLVGLKKDMNEELESGSQYMGMSYFDELPASPNSPVPQPPIQVILRRTRLP